MRGTITTIGEACTVEYGTRVVRKRDGGSKYLVYGGGGATFKIDMCNRENRVIIARFGISEVCTRFIAGQFFLNDSGLTLSPKRNNLHNRFLDYQILALNDYIFSIGRGTAQKNLDINALKRIPIYIPYDLEVQQRIVAILDEAFEGIKKAKANAEKNLQNARELFEGYLQSVYSKNMEGWVNGKIGELCTIKSGSTVNSALETPVGDYAYIKVADMNLPGNEIRISNSSRYLNKSVVSDNALIPKKSIIFPKRGGAIMTNKKRITAISICADSNIMGVIPSDAIDPDYLYYYFMQVDMRQLGSGSSIPQINNYDIQPLPITYPKSLSIQKKMVNELNTLQTDTNKLESIYTKKIAALDELKKSLLDQAFTGKL